MDIYMFLLMPKKEINYRIYVLSIIVVFQVFITFSVFAQETERRVVATKTERRVFAQETGRRAFATETVRRFRGGFYPFIKHFEWREFNETGEKLLEESGPIFGIGGLFHGVPRSKNGLNLIIDVHGELFFGEVDYDGHLQDGTPHKSKTAYSGTKIEGTCAFAIELGRYSYFKPSGGLGFRYWLRELDVDHDQRHGYDETWTTLYGIIGLGMIYFKRSQKELYGKLEIRIPFFNHETVDLSNQGGPSDIELEPGKEPSLYLEPFGMKIKRFYFSLFYEQLRFSRSNYVYVFYQDTGLIYQPKSEADIYGIKAGAIF
jgi:hypothetical protein